MKRLLSAWLEDLESQLAKMEWKPWGGGMGLISLEIFGWRGFELWNYDS